MPGESHTYCTNARTYVHGHGVRAAHGTKGCAAQHGHRAAWRSQGKVYFTGRCHRRRRGPHVFESRLNSARRPRSTPRRTALCAAHARRSAPVHGRSRGHRSPRPRHKGKYKGPVRKVLGSGEPHACSPCHYCVIPVRDRWPCNRTALLDSPHGVRGSLLRACPGRRAESIGEREQNGVS